jgi:hypothetical protein
LGYHLDETSYWNYMYLNGPASIFSGYSWSMDIFVDYAWNQLGELNSVLVALLVIEVRLGTHKLVYMLSKADEHND